MKSPQETGAIQGLYDGTSRNRHSTKPESPSQYQYQVRCTGFRVFAKNTLAGFATLVVEPLGLAIQDCSAHTKNGKRWVNFPAKSYTGEDETTHWQPLISIEGKSAYWKFQDLALAAIDDYLSQTGIDLRQSEIEGDATRPSGLKEGNTNEWPF